MSSFTGQRVKVQRNRITSYNVCYTKLLRILQPLVENAIYHGVKLKREVGKITIRAYNEQTTIVFEVEDTGKGMESKTVEAIQKALNSNEQTEVPMYGIKNVHERIQIFFGKQYGLTFKSTYGVGTIARVIIPIV